MALPKHYGDVSNSADFAWKFRVGGATASDVPKFQLFHCNKQITCRGNWLRFFQLLHTCVWVIGIYLFINTK
jgi:hypothetical protein